MFERDQAMRSDGRNRLDVRVVAALLQVLAMCLSAPAVAQPPAPTIDSVGPGSTGELRILWSWSLDGSACTIDRYQVDYKKTSETSWKTYTEVLDPNTTAHGTYEVYDNSLGSGFSSKLFVLGPNTTGHNPGEIAVTLDDVSYDVRMVAYSPACEDDDPFGISTPVSSRPEVSTAIADQSVRVGETVEVDLDGVFIDDDNDSLTLSAASSDTAKATVTVTGNTLTVTGVAVGSTTVTVTADDGKGGTADESFDVTVTAANTPPGGWTDAVLTVGVTPIKAVHMEELRTRTATVSTGCGLTAPPWTDAVLTVGVTPIKAVHVEELRTALSSASTTCGLTAPTWTDAVLTVGVTPIKAAHFMELRSAVEALEALTP